LLKFPKYFKCVPHVRLISYQVVQSSYVALRRSGEIIRIISDQTDEPWTNHACDASVKIYLHYHSFVFDSYCRYTGAIIKSARDCAMDHHFWHFSFMSLAFAILSTYLTFKYLIRFVIVTIIA